MKSLKKHKQKDQSRMSILSLGGLEEKKGTAKGEEKLTKGEL